MPQPKYTTRAEIQSFLLINVKPAFHEQVEVWIQDVSRHIDKITGRRFIANPEPIDEEESGEQTGVVRRYNGTGGCDLRIDDCVEVLGVQQGDEYGDDPEDVENYLTLPANSPSELDGPIKTIYLKNGYFTPGIANVYVNGRWGYSDTVPDDVKMAATLMVAHIYKFGRGGIRDGVKSEKIGNYQVTYADEADAQALASALTSLDHYKLYQF